jgi:hypothetical protein
MQYILNSLVRVVSRLALSRYLRFPRIEKLLGAVFPTRRMRIKSILRYEPFKNGI